MGQYEGKRPTPSTVPAATSMAPDNVSTGPVVDTNTTTSTAPAAPKRLYTVKDGGSVVFGGKMNKPGQELQLTEEEAEQLKDHVFPGRPKPAEDISKRQDGTYRVAPEHNVIRSGKFLPPGELLELKTDEARSLGDSIEPAK